MGYVPSLSTSLDISRKGWIAVSSSLGPCSWAGPPRGALPQGTGKQEFSGVCRIKIKSFGKTIPKMPLTSPPAQHTPAQQCSPHSQHTELFTCPGCVSSWPFCSGSPGPSCLSLSLHCLFIPSSAPVSRGPLLIVTLCLFFPPCSAFTDIKDTDTSVCLGAFIYHMLLS